MPKLSKCHFMATFAATAALMAGAQQVQAAGFQLKEQSAEGQGNSFAGSTAKAHDASTIFFNPAGMSRLEGNQFQANASLIMPSAEYKHGSSSRVGGTLFNDTNDNGGVTALVPSLYGVYEVNDKMKVGVSVNTPFGLSTDYKDDWVGAQYNLLSKIETITTTPSVSYQINPQLSFGVGLQIQYLGGELTRKASPVVGGDVELKADDMGVGATFGVLYQYSEGGRIGVNYRSQVNHTLDGHVKISNSTGGAADAYYRAEAELTTPDIISFGWYHELDDKWAVMSDIAWTNWSVFKELRVQDKVGTRADAVTTYQWDDTMFYSLGVNYQYDDQWKFQTGVAYDEGAANDEHRTAGIPDSDRYWLSVGTEYKMNDSVTWNIGYSHLWGDDAKVTEDSRAATGSGFAGTFENHVDIVTAGVNITF
ncbi:aromatic hydrocarbon degradation protein [Terasakiella brassicae]|uniref:Aromatic hydrocarbon degradation protein n=1 Tax=Terasakiella brassicae TaxID=1634917 RepID=A0A917F8H3_9PROT|nr:outer membrane protein transport protein [Terasakiella brassicae]GGF55462.1 aromatic hydrocarbon degradation protein [Terasakiella brassicae]